MQEEVDRGAISVTVTASKLTGRTLAKALGAVLQQIQRSRQNAQAPQGRQSVKKLMGQGVNTSAIPLDGETRPFDRIARKWKVDYAFYKTGPKKYLLLFKSGQADAITACFSEYTKRVMAKARRPSLLAGLNRAIEAVTRQKPLEHEHERKAARDGR